MVAATDAEELIATWLRTKFPVDDDPGNDIQILLAEALDSSETGIDVDDGTYFAIGDIIAVDHEMMTVTDITGNTLTVTRGTNSTAAAHDDNSVVGVFTTRHFKLAQPLQPQAVDNFPGKVTIGAYNIDSNDLLSAWVLSNLTGGHGIADHDEGVTDNRYRFGTIYTRYASQWTKPFLVTESTIGASTTGFLGDLNDNGTVLRMASSGNGHLFENTTDAGAMGSNTYDKTGNVDYSGTASQNYFHVPIGTGGFIVYNPATDTITAGGNPPDITHFCLWDEKIIGIALTGELYYSTTAAAPTVLTSYTLGGNAVRLDLSQCPPRGLRTFVNRNGESTVYVIGRHKVFAFDADTPRLYEIPDFGSHHPDFGVAHVVWRGELFVSGGMDILAFNGEVIRNIGLSRDDGLPYAIQGKINQLAAGQNSLYAIAQSGSVAGGRTTSVHEWSGYGWHCVWAHAIGGGSTPNSLVVSSAAGGYDLAWSMGSSGKVYTQALPVSFTNPREAIDNSAASFGTSWATPATNTFYLESGRFDANMKGYRKIANAVELDVRTCPANNSIVLKYRIDDDTAWTTMFHTDGDAPSATSITTAGHHHFEFGHYDPAGHYIGIDFETIEFRLEYVDTAANTTTPAVTSLVFSFLKLMNPSLAWTASIDLTTSYEDGSPQVLLNELTELRTLPRFFSIQHRARQYRARMTGMQSVELGGQEEAASVQVSLLEIPGVLGISGSDHG